MTLPKFMQKFDVLCRVAPGPQVSYPQGSSPQPVTTTIVEIYASDVETAYEVAAHARPHVMGFDGYVLHPIGLYVSGPEARWNPGTKDREA